VEEVLCADWGNLFDICYYTIYNDVGGVCLTD
jgi:hypothetical protein